MPRPTKYRRKLRRYWRWRLSPMQRFYLLRRNVVFFSRRLAELRRTQAPPMIVANDERLLGLYRERYAQQAKRHGFRHLMVIHAPPDEVL